MCLVCLYTHKEETEEQSKERDRKRERERREKEKGQNEGKKGKIEGRERLTEKTVYSQSSVEPEWLTSGSTASGLKTPPHTPSGSRSWSHWE